MHFNCVYVSCVSEAYNIRLPVVLFHVCHTGTTDTHIGDNKGYLTWLDSTDIYILYACYMYVTISEEQCCIDYFKICNWLHLQLFTKIPVIDYNYYYLKWTK